MALQHLPCERLGPYRLLEPPEDGRAQTAHRAIGPDGEMVAVTMLRRPAAADPEAGYRLAREVRAMRRVRSPFVAEVIDADVTGSIPYVVTRFPQGPALADVIAERGPLRGGHLQRLARGLAEGLAAVHAAGIVCQDLKPGNVTVTAGGLPVLTGFGIAGQAGDALLTPAGMLGAPAGFLAPEVIDGQRAQAPADVHAWGATVGFAARGAPLFGPGPYELIFWRILRADADLDGIHGALHPLITAALFRQPWRRPCAVWLASQLAGLDLAAPESLLVSMLTDRPVIATRPLPLAPPEPAERLAGRQRPGKPAGTLAAVRHQPDRRAMTPARPAGVRRRHPLLALAALALAVGASALLPAIGMLTVAVVLTVLRTGSRARAGLAARRRARGPRAWDAMLVMSSMPWALARSALETALLAPLLLGAAGGAAAAWIIWLHGGHVLPAWGAVAAAYTALSCLGPRSRPARRELGRVLASSALAAVTATLTAGVLAMIVAGLVLIQTPATWPLPDLPVMSVHVPGFRLLRFHV